MENNIGILWLGDIHMGIAHTPHLYEELMAIVPKTIEEKGQNIKAVIIVGDYFEKELVGSHKYYATKFFAELARICNEKGLALRMVKGTPSHDHNQLNGFFANTNTLLPDLNFKIINTVETENLFGLDILYIPEEQLKDQDEYYAPFKVNKYDVIAGHGTWDFAPKAAFQLGNNDPDKLASPVFLTKEWDHVIPKGFTVFGHIHSGNWYKNKYFYTSSFSRWKFGEEERKGFLYSETNLETKEYKVEFIENTLAPTYITESFENVIGPGGLKDQSLFDIRRKLKEMVDPKSVNKITINVTDLTPNEITLLQKAAKTLDNVNLKIESKKLEEVLLEEQAENEAQDYVIHPEKHGMSHEDVIIKYALEVNGKEILMSDLTNALE